MINLNDVQRGGSFTISGAVGIGDGAKTGVAITTALAFMIDGVRLAKGAAATNLPLSAGPLQPVLTTCLYLIYVNAAGTVAAIAVKPVLSADLANGAAVLKWPDMPAIVSNGNVAPVAAVRITLASTATFQPGVTALDAANVTTTYTQLFSLPANPLQS